MSNTIQAAAAANAISQERVQQTVSFPRTGDPETDCIIGFIRVASEIGVTADNLQRIMVYLLDRWKSIAEQSKQQSQFAAYQEMLRDRAYQESIKKQWGGIGTAVQPSGPTYGPIDATSPPGIKEFLQGQTLCQVFENEAKQAPKKK